MKIDRSAAADSAHRWIAAWNAHDIEAILSHYAEEIEFVSPLVVRRLGRPDGTIRAKRELRGYFEAALAPGSGLRFSLGRILLGATSWTILYANHRDELVAETMFPDASGRIARAYVHYVSIREDGSEDG
jgi:hypothetical protein